MRYLNYARITSHCVFPARQVICNTYKKRFVGKVDKDSSSCESEMAANFPSPGGGQDNGKRSSNAPKAPKRPLSAFFQFCNDERPKLAAERPDLSVPGIIKALGKMWDDADALVKARYQAMADKDKAQYARVSDTSFKLYILKDQGFLQLAVILLLPLGTAPITDTDSSCSKCACKHNQSTAHVFSSH